MTLSHEHRQELLVSTRERAAALLEDLAHIRIMLRQDVPSRVELRQLSNTLRRLLIADRDLQAVAAPRIGRIKLLAPDNKPIIRASQHIPLSFFVSGGTRLCNVTIRALVEFKVRLPDHDVKRLSSMNPFRSIEMRADNFLAQPVLCLENTWASRADAIKYVAHYGFGVHSQSSQDHAEQVLAKIRRTLTYSKSTGIHIRAKLIESKEVPEFEYDPEALDVVMIEVLAASSYVVNSPDVHEMEEIIRKELNIAV